MADLIRNPDSSNFLYVDAAKFPNELQGSSIDINDDGTFNITWKNFVGAFFPPFETEITHGTYYIGIGSEHREDIDTINIMYSDGTSSDIYPHYQSGTQSHNMNYYQTILPSNLSLRYLIIAPYNPNTKISNVKMSITTSNNIAWESAYKVVEKYTITFHDPSGTNPDVSHTVEQESPTPTPPSWTRSGYELVGWSPEIAETVTVDATYNALWATEGSDELPLTLSQLRQWGDANGHSTGTNIANPETHAVTLRQAAMLFGLDGDASMSDVGDCVITVGQFKMMNEAVPSVKIVSWADGTDEEIAAMVAAADAGQITLSDYWKAGDTRTVHLSAMSATGVGESHAEQDVQFVLTDPAHYTLSNGKLCSFVVLQKDCLSETGYMNSFDTNYGGWNGCARRTWCNSVYRNAIPEALRPIFKQFTTHAANDLSSSQVASTDYFALFSEKEIFGSTTYANSSAESQNTQLDYYKTTSNRVKRLGVNGSARYWWQRSPRSGNSSYFCFVYTDGTADGTGASTSSGLAPFGCI